MNIDHIRIYTSVVNNGILILLFLFLITGRISAQVAPKDTLPVDSVPEIIVYEDDTVFIAPDTIKYTDTIYHRIQEKTPAFIPKRELGLVYTQFVSGFSSSGMIPDSLTLAATLNVQAGIQVNYFYQKFAWYLQAGFESLHNKMDYTNSFSSNTNEISGVYDSLFTKGRYLFNHYYYYFYAQLGLGKTWEVNRWLISVYTVGYYATLYKHTPMNGYSQVIQNDLSVNSLRRNNLAVGVQLDCGYKVGSHLLLHLVPAYLYQCNAKKSHPLGDSNRLGVTFRFAFLF